MSDTLTTDETAARRLVGLVDGLRDLADWIEQHPVEARRIAFSEVTLLAPVITAGALREMGDALGACELEITDRYAQYVRTFGGVVKLQAYAQRDLVCDYVVVGERTEEIRQWMLKADQPEPSTGG